MKKKGKLIKLYFKIWNNNYILSEQSPHKKTRRYSNRYKEEHAGEKKSDKIKTTTITKLHWNKLQKRPEFEVEMDRSHSQGNEKVEKKKFGILGAK